MSRDTWQSLPMRLEVALQDHFEIRSRGTFAGSMAAHRLPLEGYFAHLCAWHAIWTEVETLAAEEPPAIWTDDLKFCGLLRSDRAYLAPLCGDPDSQVMNAAMALARQLRASWTAERVALLGALYALERILADASEIDECAHRLYGLTFSGRAFWRYQVLGGESRLTELNQRLGAIAGAGRAADRIEASARATLGGYLDVERAIPQSTELTPRPHQTPPGGFVLPRPETPATANSWGILRGAPHGRRPEGRRGS